MSSKHVLVSEHSDVRVQLIIEQTASVPTTLHSSCPEQVLRKQGFPKGKSKIQNIITLKLLSTFWQLY